MMNKKIFVFGFLLGSCQFLSGCGVLIGNVQSSDKKDTTAQYLDLSSLSDRWKKLDSKPDETLGAQDIPDVTFQNQSSNAIISLNSSCKAVSTKQDLSALTKTLLAGMTVDAQSQEEVVISDQIKGLETTAQGEMNGSDVKIRATVLHFNNCTYDLLWIGPKSAFDRLIPDYISFRNSLKLPRKLPN